jgi:hypothetical protein
MLPSATALIEDDRIVSVRPGDHRDPGMSARC